MSALARRRRERTEVAGRMISGNLSPPRVGWRGGYGRSRDRSRDRW